MTLTKIALACLVATGVTAPQFASADESFEFHGYGRQGVVYEQDGNTAIGADGQTSNAAGRLGNETDGLEVLFLKKFDSENGTKFDLGYMFEDWGNGVQTKQFFAGASNVFASQPNAYIWAGSAFHARMQQGLNDHYVTWADGKGTGIKGLELGFANLELGLVQSGWGGQYTATSRLSGIKLSDAISLELAVNYGFTDSTSDAEDAYHLVAKVDAWGQKFYYRRAENVGGDQNLSWARKDGITSDYFSVEGNFSLDEKTGLEYLVGYHSIDEASEAVAAGNDTDRTNYNIIVRPTYQWNDIHSTWLEVGYSVVDFDDAKENNEAWKVTLSQNIAVGGVTWARPMLRFYATVGEETNNQYTTNDDGDITAYNGQSTSDPLIVGAMFEAWW